MRRSVVYISTGLAILFLLGLTTMSTAQVEKWSKKTDMPTARYLPASASINGKIYVIGGWNDQRNPLATVEEYDPTTDKWSKKANTLTPRFQFCACAVNGKIYAVGGSKDLNAPVKSIEEYDPAADKWVKKVIYQL